MRLLADRPRSCLDPWLLLLSSQPPARVVEALRQHVLQPAAVSRWPERGSNLQPIRIRTRLSGELAAGRLLPCVRASTALALARVTSMRTFGGGRKRGGVDSSLPGAQRPSATLASPHPGQGSGAPRHSECSAESSPRALDGRRTRRGGRPRTSGQMSSSPEEPSALLRHPPVASGQRPGSRRRATRGQAALLSALGQSRRQLTTEGRDADGSVCCGVEREVGLEAAVDERAADEAAKRLRLRRGRPHPYGGRVPSAGEGRGGCALAGAGRAPWSGPRRGGAAAGGGVGEERPAVEERAEEEPKEERPEEPHGLRREVRPGM